MQQQEQNRHNNKKKIIHWLAHHNPNREDFNNHVIYIFNYAICIGCSAFVLGAGVALIIGNIFYDYISNFISFPIIFLTFLICWLPSIFQYSIQAIKRKPLTNRFLKFLIRFLYPLGSIILIFNSPLWGFIIAIPAGLLIIVIRKIFYKKKELKSKKI